MKSTSTTHTLRYKKHKKLTYGERKKMPRSSFALPSTRKGGKGGYPIPDKAHARNALARVSAFGSPSQKSRVKIAVHRKFPMIGKGKKSKKTKVAFSSAKARTILREKKPTLKGKPITSRQRRWLGWQAGGALPRKRKKMMGHNAEEKKEIEMIEKMEAMHGKEKETKKRKTSLIQRMRKHREGTGQRVKEFKKYLKKHHY